MPRTTTTVPVEKKGYRSQDMIPNPYGKNRMLSPAAIGYRLHIGSELLKIKDLGERRAYAAENHVKESDRSTYMQIAGVFGDSQQIYSAWTIRRTHWKILEILSQPIIGDERRRMIASLIFHWIECFHLNKSSENSLAPTVAVVEAALHPENLYAIRVMYNKYLHETHKEGVNYTLLEAETPPLIGVAKPVEEEASTPVEEEASTPVEEEASTPVEEGAQDVPSDEVLEVTEDITTSVAPSNGHVAETAPNLNQLQETIVSELSKRFYGGQRAQLQKEADDRLEEWRTLAEQTFTSIENVTRITLERVGTEIFTRKAAQFTKAIGEAFDETIEEIKKTLRETYAEDMRQVGELRANITEKQAIINLLQAENAELRAQKSQQGKRMGEIRDFLGMADELTKAETDAL